MGYARMSQLTASPKIRRRKSDRKRMPIFLPAEIWKELSYAAEFATKGFEYSGKPETVSRNDFIEDAIGWALAAYWEDKGGRPTSAKQFEERAKAHGARVAVEDKQQQDPQ